MPSGTTSKRLRLPAHQAKAHQRLMEKLRSPAASEEVFRSAVKAGIYTEHGELTEHYREGGEKAGKPS